MQGEPIPGIVYEYGLNQRFLPEITLAEVNALAKEWVPDRNRLVVISAPEKDRALAARPRRRWRRPSRPRPAAPLTAYVDTVSTQPLLDAAADARRRSPATTTQRRAGHHRVAAVQRRPRRAEADDVQGGRNSVSRRQPRRHVARERRGLHRRGNRRRGGRARRARHVCRSIDLDKVLAGTDACRAGRHRRHGRRTRRRRRRAKISRRCFS